jgi:ferricrocin synthase
VEEIIASVLAEIAGVPKEEITRVTTLFHLGLDSISAIKVSSALKKSISLYVSAMLKNPTVENMTKVARPLSQFIKTILNNQDFMRRLDQSYLQRLKSADITKDQVESRYDCSPGQLFFLGVWTASGHQLYYPEM